MQLRSRFAVLAATVLLLGALIVGGSGRIMAQDDGTPEVTDTTTAASRPAHVHSGSCDTLGEVIQPLTDLTAPVGTAAGLADDNLVEYSFSNVAMSLTDMLAADHAVNIHESVDNIQNYIACGDVGGVVDANGSLVIALHEQNDSDFSGIAVLTTSAVDPATTDVSVFIHQDDDDLGDADDADLDDSDDDEDAGDVDDDTSMDDDATPDA